MDLLEIGPALDPGAADIARRLGGLAGVGGQAAEQALGQIDEPGMLKPAGAGKDQPARPVVARHVLDHRLARHGGHDLFRPQDRPAHRLVGVGGLLQQVEHEIVGRILDLPDLLQDDVPLLLQLLGIERRVLQDIGQQVRRQPRRRRPGCGHSRRYARARCRR